MRLAFSVSRYAYLCLLLLLAFVISPPAKAAVIPYALDAGEDSPRYTIDVQLDFVSGKVTARETLALTNRYDEDLVELVFNATAARRGAETITGVSVNGAEVSHSLDGVVLTVKLASPLRPQDSALVSIDFQATVPAPGDMRFGRSRGIVALGNWYPVLSPYHPGQGWDKHPYVDIGDAFASETADYEVNLTVTPSGEDVTVAHAGVLASRTGNTWHMQSEQVRDFAMTVAQRYMVSSAVVDGIEIDAYYLPEHSTGGAIYMQTAVEAVRLYNSLLGKYPFPRLSIAESSGNDPGWVGQEYPTIVFIGSSSTGEPGQMGDYLSYAVAHEIAHQWFYSLVGNDQVYEPWVDEAFASYLGYQYLRNNYPSSYQGFWSRLNRTYQAAATSYGRKNVDSSIYDFSSEEHYYAMVYRQGSLFLEDLRGALGDDAFWQLLRDYVARYSYQMATGHDFLAMAQQKTANDLKPLFARYFGSGMFASSLDYDIADGHFYSQASGQAGSEGGFSVTNRDGVRFWDEFRRLGGVEGVGYPASRRFVWDGFVSQVFQKGVFQWRPEAGTAYMVNVFDQMSSRGLDTWLRTVRDTPPIANWSADSALSWPATVARHQQVLGTNEAIQARYFAALDPINLYGLPMTQVEDMGNAYVMRAQRAIIQQWKSDVAWAKAGDVTVANGGDIAKESGLIPAQALRLEDGP